MALFRSLVVLLLLAAFSMTTGAGQAQTPEASEAPARAETGGAQTLEDILARQRGEQIDDSFRRTEIGDPGAAATMNEMLGTLGGASDSDVWRALRYNQADVQVSSRVAAAEVLMQDGGMRWLEFRSGPLKTYGGYLLLGMLAVLVVFFALRGRIRIDGEKTGRRMLRFSAIERFAHWMLAGSFILLAITGLVQLFGRAFIIPLIGREAFAPVALAGKWVHNNFAWPFMLALLMVIVFWLVHNLPNRHDLKWLAKGGGLFSKGTHPPAKKFNAGQKLIFWAVVVLGLSISASGLALLFPFQMPLFAVTFEKLNALGLPQLFGYGALPEVLAPHEEMQLAQAWHAIVAFVFMAIIMAHIYLGSVGMEGAFDAMGSGEVEEQWAKEHHSLWFEEEKEKQATASKKPAAQPAE
ncbi:formate dehydrogenase subunit gamma [Alkalilacustris brevis]|uniref:formate dehydrogenase subunit gamma n=1 Tax=Alkalilacustris brevis TaxID=2026338 RepID=UPI000E0E00D9|nr:formate dehydrogenase subunit gamma [Alkalilacustris brevis]